MSTNKMLPMMLILADAMSYDDLIEQVEQHIAEYKQTKILKKPENEQMQALEHLTVYTTMLTSKVSGARSGIDVFDQMEEISKVERAMKFFEPGKQ